MNAYCWWGNQRERNHIEDTGIGFRIILNWVFMKWVWGKDWIDVVPNRDTWNAVVSAVTDVRIP